MNKNLEQNINEAIQIITKLKEKYSDEINNSVKVNRIFQEIVYYYRDLLIMGYSINNMTNTDRQYLDFLEELLVKEALEYNKTSRFTTLNEQVEFISHMNLSEEEKLMLIKSLYKNFGVQYTPSKEEQSPEFSNKQYSKK